MYSNEILNFQKSTTILNVCTKKVWKLIVCTTYTIYSSCPVTESDGHKGCVDHIRPVQNKRIISMKKQSGSDRKYPYLSYAVKKTRPEDNFVSVTNLCNRKSIATNLTPQLNQSYEKDPSTSTVKRRLLNWPIWQKWNPATTVEAAKQCQKAPVGQSAHRLDREIKSFKQTNQSLKFRGHMGGSIRSE